MVSTWILLSQLNFRRMITGYYCPIETLTFYCKASLWLPAVGNKELLRTNNFCTFQVTKGNLALSMRCQVGWHRSLSKVLEFSDIIPISTNFLQFANNIFFCKSSSDSFPLNSVYFCYNLMIFGSITPPLPTAAIPGADLRSTVDNLYNAVTALRENLNYLDTRVTTLEAELHHVRRECLLGVHNIEG